MLGCINKDITIKYEEVIIPLYSALFSPYLEYRVQFWSPLYKKNVDRLERVQRIGHKDDERTGQPAVQGKAERTVLVQPEEKKAQGTPYFTMFQYLTGGYQKDGGSIFARIQMEKIKGNGYKLLLVRSPLDIRRKFLTMRTDGHWNYLPREVTDSPILDSSRLSLTRCRAISFKLCSYLKRSDQIIHSNLVFYDSICIQSEQKCQCKHTKGGSPLPIHPAVRS